MTLAEPTTTAKKASPRHKPKKKAEPIIDPPPNIPAVNDKQRDPLDEDELRVPVSFELHMDVISQLRDKVEAARRSEFVEQAIREKLHELNVKGVAEIAAWLESVHGKPDPEEVDRVGRELFEGWGT